MSASGSDDGSVFDPWEYLPGGDGNSDTEDDPGSVESVSPFDQSTIDVLQTFGSSPVGFIFGVVLTPILNGIEGVVRLILYYLNLVAFGDSRASTDGTLGLVDVPRLASGAIIEAGNLIGEPILNEAIDPLVDGLIGIGDWAGPWGLLGAAIALVVIVNLYAATLRKALEIVLDLIPGGGAILE
ncbi:hypothetical protein [Halomicrobium katesii]|uniref:hypothetical protein n=1 Tax=Halomicrobium katesii TaxID=437163 RepID=UPI00035F4CA1|nr:hypothetical protein [Halomicrobium katesii]